MSKSLANRKSKKSSEAAITISVAGNNNAVATEGSLAIANHSREFPSGELDDWQRQMEKAIISKKKLPKGDKSILLQNIEQITQEVKKGRKASVSRIERLLNIMAAMSTDIFEVAITTLINPLTGLGLVAQKIGDKAKVVRKG